MPFRSALLILALFGAMHAQQPVFRADSRLVLVGFHAVRGDEFVRDLRPEDIVIREDGEPRPVAGGCFGA